MDPFPLLHLPLLMVQAVIRKIKPIELICMSLISMKMFNVVLQFTWRHLPRIKSNRAHCRFIFEMDGTEYVIAVTDGNAWNDTKNAARCRFDNVTVPIFRSARNDARLITVWIDYPTGIRIIGKYIKRLFRREIEQIEFWARGQKDFGAVVDLVVHQQPQLKHLWLHGEDVHEPDLEQLLQNVVVTDYLQISSNLSPEFSYIQTRPPAEACFPHASWFNFYDLEYAPWEKLSLGNSNFTNRNLDRFVRRWRNGDFPKLKVLVVQSDRINARAPIAGMNPPIQNPNQREVWNRVGSISYDVSSGIEIQSDGGVRAVLHVSPGSHLFFFHVSD